MTHKILQRMSLKRQRFLLLGVIMALIALALVQSFRYRYSTLPMASDFQNALWKTYLLRYWSSGRTFDPANNNDTTSEAQGYTMLRAVWQNDQPVFTKTWGWTQTHLQRPDKLFSWLWNGQILSQQGGYNTASDADTDIALALVLAAGRWHNNAYLSQAEQIIPSIWHTEVVSVKGTDYLTADNLEGNSSTPLINPSYFEPYAYRIFFKLDSADNWSKLVDDSYKTLQQASQQQLGSGSSDNLPPDWVAVNRQSGQLQPAAGKDTNFGFDAFRAVWRPALDYEWNHSAQAKNILASYSSLIDDWNNQHKLWAIYGHDGRRVANYSSVALYGGTLGYFIVIHPATAKVIYQKELANLYNSRTRQLTTNLNYYDNNWAWFGTALYEQNLSEFLPGAAT